MTEDEMNAAIEREIDTTLEAEIHARKAKMRAEIAVRLRREAALAHRDRINAKAPIEGPLAGLTPEQDAGALWPNERGPLTSAWTRSIAARRSAAAVKPRPR
jgi:hypothetical protein